MSKLKLRKRSKIFSEELENRCLLIKYFFQKPIDVITHFDCDKNSKYARAICNYELISAFKIHNLWIRILNKDTSYLVCEFNKDKRVVHDLSPFWDILDLIDSGKDDNNSIMNLIKKYENEYDLSTPLTYKDKYKIHKKNKNKLAQF